MWDVLYYLLIVAFLAATAVIGALFVRGYLTGTMPSLPMFSPRPEKRLEVVEQSSIDGRRRLLLVRRDDVEHLIMTGGPVDVVIETGIGQKRPRPAEVVEAAAPVFTRQPRSFGQAVGEQ